MAVITNVLGTTETLKGQFRCEDPLILSSDERASPHMLGQTVGGRRLRISLPRESELNDGDVLVLDGDVAVIVRAGPEQLFVVRPPDASAWGVAGFQLGNLHRPVRFTEDAMLTPADPMVADMLTRLNIPYEEHSIPFVGRRYGSFTGHRHDHDHSHSRDHDHHGH